MFETVFGVILVVGILLIAYGVYTDMTADSTPESLNSLPMFFLGIPATGLGALGLIISLLL